MREKILGKLSYIATQLHNRIKPAEAWNIKPESFAKYPVDTLGHHLFLFYKQNKFHPIAGMEYHDADHIILELNTDVKSEVILQFFLWGNGKRTFFSTLACLGAIIIIPEIWFNCLLAYKKGRTLQPIWHLNLRYELNNTIDQVRSKVLKPKNPGHPTIPTGIFYHKIF